jgi:hypothetical protein
MAVRTKKTQPLDPKEEVFLEGYLTHWNGARAAREAGYDAKSARQTAHELLTKPYIIAAKEERLKELRMSTDEWYARVTEHARGDLGDLLDGAGAIDLAKARKGNHLRLVSEYQVEESTRRDEEGNPVPVVKTKVKLYSAQKALDMLAPAMETRRDLVETQVELAQHKLDELRKEEALLALLKQKASKEVFEEVVNVLAGRSTTRSKTDNSIALDFDDGPQEQDQDPAPEASPPPEGDS